MNDASLERDRAKWKPRKSFKKAFIFLPVVRLDNPNRDVNAFLKLLSARLEHRISFPDPGAGAEKNLKTAATLLLQLLRHDFEQLIGVGPFLFHGFHGTSPLDCRSAVKC